MKFQVWNPPKIGFTPENEKPENEKLNSSVYFDNPIKNRKEKLKVAIIRKVQGYFSYHDVHYSMQAMQPGFLFLQGLRLKGVLFGAK